MFVDNQDNIYMAFPYSDFRKYDSLGNIVYRKEIFVHRFAVDNSQNVLYTDMNKMSFHSVNKINIDGSVSPGKHNFSLKGENANITWIKANHNGEIIFGREFNSYKVMEGELVELSNESQKPSAETKEVDPNSWQENFYSIYRLEDGEETLQEFSARALFLIYSRKISQVR